MGQLLVAGGLTIAPSVQNTECGAQAIGLSRDEGSPLPVFVQISQENARQTWDYRL